MRAVLMSLMLVTTTACNACGGMPWVEVGGERFCVELAVTPEERARGLMFRDSLADGHGMVFLFEHEEHQSFWMKNTRIPLDILYFDAERRLVSASERTPPCRLGDRCPSYPSDGPAKYVLELNAGEAARLGLQRGAELKFGPGIAAD